MKQFFEDTRSVLVFPKTGDKLKLVFLVIVKKVLFHFLYFFLQVFPVHFLSCPAVNKGRVDKAQSGAATDLEPVEQVMRRR